jgi:hypothetical protein
MIVTLHKSFYALAVIAASGMGGLAKSELNSLDKNYIVNASFEMADSVQISLPSGWNVDVANKTDGIDTVRLDSEIRRCGNAAVRIVFTKAMNYSGVIQTIDATDLVGKSIDFSGYVRSSSAKSIIGIWMLVADTKGKKLRYINSYTQPVKSTDDWSRHSVSIRIPKAAASIKFGAAIYEEDGTMWADDLRLSASSDKPALRKSCNLKATI